MNDLKPSKHHFFSTVWYHLQLFFYDPPSYIGNIKSILEKRLEIQQAEERNRKQLAAGLSSFEPKK